MLVVLGAIFLFDGFSRAQAKPFWYDELFTYYISQLPSMADIWKGLSAGLDQVPPLFFLLTRWSQDILGKDELGTRVPAILGMALMAGCVYRFLEKRSGAAAGFIAVLFVFLTLADYYVTEARPYGLLMGWCGLSLVCWQAAAEKPRSFWPIGLALSLGAAVATHFYACLLFVPIMLGELVRSLTAKKIESRIWLALVAGAAPYFGFLPILRGARAVLAHYYSPPDSHSILIAYRDLLTPLATPAVAALIAAAFFIQRPRHSDPVASAVDTTQPREAPLHEIAALTGLALLPIIGWFVALITNAYVTRYVLPSVIGMGGLLAICVARAGKARSWLSPVLLLLLMVWFSGGELFDAWGALTGPSPQSIVLARHRMLVQAWKLNVPIVITSPETFFEIGYYAPPGGPVNLVYLNDREAALRYLGNDTSEIDFPVMCKIARLNCQAYDDFVPSHPRFLMYRMHRSSGDWLIPKLLSQRTHVRLLDTGPTAAIYETGDIGANK